MAKASIEILITRIDPVINKHIPIKDAILIDISPFAMGLFFS